MQLRYWKPIQTGIEQDDDTESVRVLGACRDAELLRNGIRLERPVSPHLAARLSGRTIDLASVVGMGDASDPHNRLVVEGAGGVLVPVNEQHFMIDLMTRLGLPVLVVAKSTLGTINHTLLTLEALRSRSLEVAGMVLVGPKAGDNAEAIATFGQVHVLGELPILPDLTADALKAWADTNLDREARLERLFR